MEGDGLGRRMSPWSRGPNDGRYFLSGEYGINLRRIIEHAILYIYRVAGVVLVLDFGLRQRGLIVHAPVDGAQTFVDESIFVKREERREHDRLVLRSHGRV